MTDPEDKRNAAKGPETPRATSSDSLTERQPDGVVRIGADGEEETDVVPIAAAAGAAVSWTYPYGHQVLFDGIRLTFRHYLSFLALFVVPGLALIATQIIALMTGSQWRWAVMISLWTVTAMLIWIACSASTVMVAEALVRGETSIGTGLNAVVRRVGPMMASGGVFLLVSVSLLGVAASGGEILLQQDNDGRECCWLLGWLLPLVGTVLLVNRFGFVAASAIIEGCNPWAAMASSIHLGRVHRSRRFWVSWWAATGMILVFAAMTGFVIAYSGGDRFVLGQFETGWLVFGLVLLPLLPVIGVPMGYYFVVMKGYATEEHVEAMSRGDDIPAASWPFFFMLDLRRRPRFAAPPPTGAQIVQAPATTQFVPQTPAPVAAVGAIPQSETTAARVSPTPEGRSPSMIGEFDIEP